MDRQTVTIVKLPGFPKGHRCSACKQPCCYDGNSIFILPAGRGPTGRKIYHLRCWEPGTLSDPERFIGYQDLPPQHKDEVYQVIQEWKARYNLEDDRLSSRNIAIMRMQQGWNMDHRALRPSPEYSAFEDIFSRSYRPVLDCIRQYVDVNDLRTLSQVSKHCSTVWGRSVWDRDELWKDLCNPFPARQLRSGQPPDNWMRVYDSFTNKNASQGYCVECGKPTDAYRIMFCVFVCNSCHDLYDKYGVTEVTDVDASILDGVRTEWFCCQNDTPRKLFCSEADKRLLRQSP